LHNQRLSDTIIDRLWFNNDICDCSSTTLLGSLRW
jgi:hypothetical protein